MVKVNKNTKLLSNSDKIQFEIFNIKISKYSNISKKSKTISSFVKRFSECEDKQTQEKSCEDYQGLDCVVL